jgi:hypothetical protein
VPEYHLLAVRRMNKSLWIGGSFIVVTGFALKQILWNKVSTDVTAIRDREHYLAVEHLQAAYSNARKFSLKPLTDDERDKLKLLRAHDISRISTLENVSNVEEKQERQQIHLMTSEQLIQGSGMEQGSISTACCEKK